MRGKPKKQNKKNTLYRITWRHEVFIEAANDLDAIHMWEDLNLRYIGNHTASNKKVLADDYVETCSFENVDDDYREVSH